MTTLAPRLPRALLWDVDGTLAETERDGHRVAFNLAFEAAGLPWRWDVSRYGELLAVSGGRERLLHDMRSRADAPVLGGERDALAAALHARKNAFYADLVRGAALPLRGGVAALIDECLARGVRMAVATTTSRSNVDALLRMHLGARWAEAFGAIVCGEDVACKKPDPEVYLRTLAMLGIGPLDAVAIEDSPGGVAAARSAQVPVIVTRSAYFGSAAIDGAIAIGPGLDRRQGWHPAAPSRGDAGGRDGSDGLNGPIGLDDIAHWAAQMDIVSQHD